MFWLVLFGGLALVALQGFFAYYDDFFRQAQMQKMGIKNGYSFLEHGAMWADAFVVSPMIAFLVTRYRFGYTKWWGLLTLACALAFAFGTLPIYAKIGLKHPVPHTHDGFTTIVGYIHAVFFAAAFWIGGMFYFTPTNPPASTHDILIISGILTPFFFFAIADLSPNWEFMTGAKIQFAIEVALLWTITWFKVHGR